MGGPFISADQVESFLTTSVDQNEKKKMLKLDIHCATDITILLPRADPLSLSSRKQGDKTAIELAECLMVLLGGRDRQILD